MDNLNYKVLTDLIAKFQLPKQDTITSQVIKLEKLTPDSDAMLVNCHPSKQLVSGKLYVLYSEDYIESLDYVRKKIEEWFPSKVQKFVEPVMNTKFKDTPGAENYMQPDNEIISKWIKYAVPYGHRYMFMAAIKPSKSNASYWAS